jgi:hypothetical protein
MECSNKGTCGRSTGECNCFHGYDGVACQRASCLVSPTAALATVCASRRDSWPMPTTTTCTSSETRMPLWDASATMATKALTALRDSASLALTLCIRTTPPRSGSPLGTLESSPPITVFLISPMEWVAVSESATGLFASTTTSVRMSSLLLSRPVLPAVKCFVSNKTKLEL